MDIFALRITYDHYTVEFNPITKIPEWTCYVLTPGEARTAIATKGARKGLAFHSDPAALGSPSPLNYRKSGYDMGHCVPAADLPGDPQTFLTTNCAPQNPLLNRAKWRMIELQVRKLAATEGPALIYTGTLTFAAYPRRIGRNQVTIPDFYFKAVQTPGKSHFYLAENN